MALYIQQQRAGTAAATTFNQIRQQQSAARLDGGYRYIKLARMAYYVNKDVYLATLSQHIGELEKALPTDQPAAQAVRA